MNTEGDYRRSRFWKGIMVGALGLLVLLGIIAAISFVAMGRCPMCWRMMQLCERGV